MSSGRRYSDDPVSYGGMNLALSLTTRSAISQKRSVAVLWTCSAILAVAGCVISSFSGPVRWAVFAILFIVVFLVIWRVGLFKPVLQHHYDNRGNVGVRTPGAKPKAAPGTPAPGSDSPSGGEL